MSFEWLLAQAHHSSLSERLKIPTIQFGHGTNLSLESSLQERSGISLAVLAFYIHASMWFWCNQYMYLRVEVYFHLIFPHIFYF